MAKLKIKIFLVDDDERAINRMKILLDPISEVEVAGAITNPNLALEAILKAKPDLVFLDVEMPGKTGLEIAEDLRKSLSRAKVIFVTSHDHYAIKAIKKEAFDYLLKPVDLEELKIAIQRFIGRVQINLSQRELEIIRLVAKGLTSQQIGEKLCLSRHTVDTHRRTILEKTACRNALELVKFATEHWLV